MLLLASGTDQISGLWATLSRKVERAEENKETDVRRAKEEGSDAAVAFDQYAASCQIVVGLLGEATTMVSG
jgi:hypothetical protein